MSWYELLLTIHVLAAALWFGSGIATTVLAYRFRAAPEPLFGQYSVAANWWAGRAHPAAAVVILLAGFGMLAEADISIGETWIVLALVFWVALMALGGGAVGPTATKLAETATGGGTATDIAPLTSRLLLLMRIESVLLVIVIAIMVAKPD